MPTYQNYIDGAWVASSSGDLFENRNPANGDDLIGLFPKSTSRDVADAVDAARSAYLRWRLVPAPRRAEILFKAAQLFAERKEALARDMTREMGKVLAETRGDVQEAIDMTFFMAGEGRRQYGQTVPSELRDKFAMSVRQPLGVSAVITPWNFPMAIPSWKVIPALVCGNTVVFKPATLTPLSAVNFVKVLEEAGVPRGVVNLVTGGGDEVGNAMTTSAAVRVVSFTGSTAVGRVVSERAAPTFKKVHLEMGGKNVIIVMDDANLELAIDGCLWGGFGTSGQRCTAASRVVVHEAVYREFLDRFVARARSLRVGDGLDPEIDMGPSISEGQLETVRKYVEIGQKEGARLACGGHALTAGPYARGYFHEPTIFADVAPTMRIAQEEIFGPVLCIMPYQTVDEAVEIANDTVYGLGGHVQSANLATARAGALRIRTGQVHINHPAWDPYAPFGGYKRSGNGREYGAHGLDEYLETKAVLGFE
jgi:aldehyde dehydrogenase (NAD+)